MRAMVGPAALYLRGSGGDDDCVLQGGRSNQSRQLLESANEMLFAKHSAIGSFMRIAYLFIFTSGSASLRPSLMNCSGFIIRRTSSAWSCGGVYTVAPVRSFFSTRSHRSVTRRLAWLK